MSGWLDLPDPIVQRLEGLDALDPVLEPVQSAVRAAIPSGTAVKDALSGSWLGHPLHPLLTDVVIGTWLSAFVLDLLGGEERRQAAGDLVGLGVLAAVPTALSGASDWAELRGGTRRIGAVHALGNSTALGLQALSWRARRRGDHAAGVRLSGSAFAIAGVSAWLGGHLSYRRGVGVDQTAFEEPPTAWTAVIDEDKLEPDELTRRSAHGTGVVLLRHGSKVHALVDRCSHRGCSLSEGTFDGTAIVCGCHGSRFGLDGSLLRGPATAPQPVLETRTHHGRIEVRKSGGS